MENINLLELKSVLYTYTKLISKVPLDFSFKILFTETLMSLLENLIN